MTFEDSFYTITFEGNKSLSKITIGADVTIATGAFDIGKKVFGTTKALQTTLWKLMIKVG